MVTATDANGAKATQQISLVVASATNPSARGP